MSRFRIDEPSLETSLIYTQLTPAFRFGVLALTSTGAWRAVLEVAPTAVQLPTAGVLAPAVFGSFSQTVEELTVVLDRSRENSPSQLFDRLNSSVCPKLLRLVLVGGTLECTDADRLVNICQQSPSIQALELRGVDLEPLQIWDSHTAQLTPGEVQRDGAASHLLDQPSTPDESASVGEWALKSLQIIKCPGLTDNVLVQLQQSGLPRYSAQCTLHTLVLSHSHMLSSLSVQLLSYGFPMLERLDLSGEAQEGSGLGNHVVMQLCTTLRRSLPLDHVNLLRDCKCMCDRLTHFVFTDCNKLTERAVLSLLMGCSELRALRVTNCDWSDTGGSLNGLCEELKLELLEIGSTRISDPDAVRLLELSPKLREVDFSGCANLSDSTLTAAAGCAELTVLRMAYCGITDGGVQQVAHCLTRLRVFSAGRSWCEASCCLGHAAAVALAANAPHLRRLSLRMAQLTPDTIWNVLVQAPLLTHLDLTASCGLSGMLPAVNQLHQLHSLQLSRCNGLAAADLLSLLAATPALLQLDVSHNPSVTDEVVLEIGVSCPQLVELSLHHCPIVGTDCLYTESRDVLFRVLELLDVRNCFGLQIENLAPVDGQPANDPTPLNATVQAYTLRGCVVKSAIGESGSAYSACRDAASEASIWEVNESF